MNTNIFRYINTPILSFTDRRINSRFLLLYVSTLTIYTLASVNAIAATDNQKITEFFEMMELGSFNRAVTISLEISDDENVTSGLSYLEEVAFWHASAIAIRETGRPVVSAGIFAELMKGLVKRRGLDDELTLRALADAGRTEIDKKNYDGAKIFLEAARSGLTKLEGANHEWRAYTSSSLALLYSEISEDSRAKEELDNTLSLIGDFDEENYENYAGIMFNISKAYQNLGENDQSQILLGQVIEFSRQGGEERIWILARAVYELSYVLSEESNVYKIYDVLIESERLVSNSILKDTEIHALILIAKARYLIEIGDISGATTEIGRAEMFIIDMPNGPSNYAKLIDQIRNEAN